MTRIALYYDQERGRLALSNSEAITMVRRVLSPGVLPTGARGDDETGKAAT